MTRRDFNIRTREQILMISSFERTKWIRNRCPRRRASTFGIIGVCFRGRFALARISTAWTVWSSVHWPPIHCWQPVIPTTCRVKVSEPVLAYSVPRVTHMSSTYGQISRRCLISFQVECLRSELKSWRNIYWEPSRRENLQLYVFMYIAYTYV